MAQSMKKAQQWGPPSPPPSPPPPAAVEAQAAVDGAQAPEAAAVEDDGGLSKEADHYAVLGVAHDADERTISQAYRMASLRWHPDRAGGSKAAFQRVQQAYETLNEPSRRSDYDNGAKEERERENIYSSWRHLYCPFGDPFERKRKAKKIKCKSGKCDARRCCAFIFR